MKTSLDGILTTTIIVAAVTVSVSVVKVAFFTGGGGTGAETPELLDEERWRESLGDGMLAGNDTDAAITIMVFEDLECPACKTFHTVLKQVVADRGEDVRLVYMHFPLDYHRFARPAARAWECAANLGAATEWADAVYSKQDSLGLKSWGSYAEDAGISDTLYVHECAMGMRTVPLPRIEAGIRWAEEFVISGTPGIVINGWRLSTVPSADELHDIIEDVLSGRTLE